MENEMNSIFTLFPKEKLTKEHKELMIKLTEKYIGKKIRYVDINPYQTDLFIGNGNLRLAQHITWRNIKMYIDNAKDNDRTCGICLEENRTRVHCQKCRKFHCIKCYIKIFIDNKGLIICPFCRDKFGYCQSDEEIAIGVYRLAMEHNINLSFLK